MNNAAGGSELRHVHSSTEISGAFSNLQEHDTAFWFKSPWERPPSTCDLLHTCPVSSELPERFDDILMSHLTTPLLQGWEESPSGRREVRVRREFTVSSLQPMTDHFLFRPGGLQNIMSLTLLMKALLVYTFNHVTSSMKSPDFKLPPIHNY
ncbi:unnamed protein product [Pleuronectes platessa]|uniref:Uncharacterized protein n=1 Tax=Pleuronectes platessa TaxID=8262 RepID=A0A9N7VL89_PLEPL|nr:unnamed protein product [Pleuronectes platessa]